MSQDHLNKLQDDLKKLHDHLDASVNWNDYLPGYADRDQWLNLEKSVLERLKSAGESALKEAWPALPATLYMDYFRTGNRVNFQKSQRIFRNLCLKRQ